jgi:hypothetical protein
MRIVMQTTRFLVPALLLAVLGTTGATRAQENPSKIAFAGGKLVLEAPEAWQRKQPRTRIVEHEFVIPAAKGDAHDGRLTLMGAGGGVQANIDRWIGQFTQPDGGSTRERAKVKQRKIAGDNVHLVDISGTYKDQPGPFAPGVQRPKYRMLAAIIPTKSMGTYYVKLYGPQRTVMDHEKAFLEMIDGLDRN